MIKHEKTIAEELAYRIRKNCKDYLDKKDGKIYGSNNKLQICNYLVSVEYTSLSFDDRISFANYVASEINGAFSAENGYSLQSDGIEVVQFVEYFLQSDNVKSSLYTKGKPGKISESFARPSLFDRARKSRNKAAESEEVFGSGFQKDGTDKTE